MSYFNKIALDNYGENSNYTDPSIPNPSSDLFDGVLDDLLHHAHKSLVDEAHKSAIEKIANSNKTGFKPKGTIMNNDNNPQLQLILSFCAPAIIISESTSVGISSSPRGKGRPSAAESRRMERSDKDGEILLDDEISIMAKHSVTTAEGWLRLVSNSLSRPTLSKSFLDDIDWVFFRAENGVSFDDVCSMGSISPDAVRNEMFHVLDESFQKKLLAMDGNSDAIDLGLVVDLSGVCLMPHKMSEYQASKHIESNDSAFDIDAFNAEFNVDDDENEMLASSYEGEESIHAI